MFGYVQVLKPELKVKDYETYHAFYCGLCKCLLRQYGFLGQLTLTYDMTFLAILLTSVYDLPVTAKTKRCTVHPVKRHLTLSSKATEYAAHMNIILSYYHFKDDREDEHTKKAWLGMRLYQNKLGKAAVIYRQKSREIRSDLEELSRLEAQEAEAMVLADCFGRLMETLFCYRDDMLSQYLKKLAYHMGRFLYLMDAYEDLAEDRQKGRFNPLTKLSAQENYEETVRQMLLGEMENAGASFQKLPCLSYQDILGNIIYAGVWNRYDRMQAKQQDNKGAEDRKKRRKR